jgi:hypothetical protein
VDKGAAAENVWALVESALKPALDETQDDGLALFRAAVVDLFTEAAFYGECGNSHLVDELLALARDSARPAVLAAS